MRPGHDGRAPNCSKPSASLDGLRLVFASVRSRTGAFFMGTALSCGREGRSAKKKFMYMIERFGPNPFPLGGSYGLPFGRSGANQSGNPVPAQARGRVLSATSCKSTPNFHVVHDSGRLRRPCCRSASRSQEALRAPVTALGRRPLFLLVPLSGQATGSPRRRSPDLRASLRMILSKPARAFGHASNRLGAHRPRNPF